MLRIPTRSRRRSRNVPLVGDGADLGHVCLFEDELDQPSHGLGAKTATLRLARYGDANFGAPLIDAHADTHVSNEFIG
jgi:hypothetical protein